MRCLLIARLEAGAVEETAARFDLGDLVRDVAELYEPVAEEAGLGLDIAVERGIEISANRQLVGQAVANLADNAIKYALPGCGRRGSAAHRGQRRRATEMRPRSASPTTGRGLRRRTATGR